MKSSKAKRSDGEEKLKEETKKKRYTDYIEKQKDIIEDLKIEISDFKAKYDDRERDTEIL